MSDTSEETDKKPVQEKLVEQYGEEYKKSRQASKEFMESIPTDEYGIRMMNGKADPMPRFHSGSLRVDEAMGGGVPKGRILEVFGSESSGKTTLCIHCLAEMQKQGEGTLFIDAEHALDPEYAENLGVSMKALALAQPDSGEDALNLCTKAAKSGNYGLIVVDSVSALTPQAELEGDVGDDHVGLQARMMSQAMRKIRAVAKSNNCTIIFTNQIRKKIGGWGNPNTTSGGQALKFYSSIRIKLSYTGKKEENGEAIGSTIEAYCKKNKTAPPFRKANTLITYGKGINRNWELLSIAIDAGVIEKRGSWYTLIRANEDHARHWEGIAAGLDPESDSFEDDLEDIPVEDDDLEKTIAQGENAMLSAMEENSALYDEIMQRSLQWYRKQKR